MYVVTFYSFKGGVGRTMAMLNVASELARRGRKVLVVDFDLEAPGVATYEPFQNIVPTRGIVDYVTAYKKTRHAPDISDFVSQTIINGETIWFMSPGIQDAEYPNRLSAIDWLSLYEEYDGYLMFEDLKQQWDEILGVDYVFIDSRTGHTDVGGICTRQLPDAVVLMFFPNEQNISGLQAVAHNVRMEAPSPTGRRASLHFCPSNVPDLDDEEHILRNLLKSSEERLEYQAPAAVIHHYNSLSLLEQCLFVLERPNSKLSSEYRQLTETIISLNFNDKEGVLARLEWIRGLLRSNKGTELIQWDELSRIGTIHADDTDVAWSLSQVFALTGDTEAELATLNIAVTSPTVGAEARSRRATVLIRESRFDTENEAIATEDLRAVIASPTASGREIAKCIELLKKSDQEWLSFTTAALGKRRFSSSELFSISQPLITDRQGAKLSCELFGKLRDDEDPDYGAQFVLSLIGSGRFQAAMDRIGNRGTIIYSSSIADVFNFACAEWGVTGQPSKELFSRVLELIESDNFSQPNYCQCIAMSYAATEKSNEAIKLLEKARVAINRLPIDVFSCWRFLNATSKEFLADLNALEGVVRRGELLRPMFVDCRQADI